uniref:Uncharacterized protein n=2 Tax=Guillardia theta TaxID=55529 RepID=A0A7S4KPP2_GUITH|mmetsp:Transcript_28653/g.92415  ORF Transcript_28653/g.92415 Transcript_28653/m.92415 type:complete len:360 (+) Transcript_28653:122-1201(+)
MECRRVDNMARIPGGRRSTASHTEVNESDVSAQEEEEPSLSKSQTKKEKSTRSSSRTSLKRSRTEFQGPAVQESGQKAQCLLYSEEQEETFVKTLKDLSSINKLTVAGEGLQASNEFGETYLHFAAFTGRPDLVKWLLDKGAQCDARDNKGRTPLARCASGDVECVKILIQRGADVDLADNEGITPLHYAALSQSFANLKLLLEAGAQINSYDKVNGCSPLHDACYGGDLKCVKALVEAKAVVDMPTNPEKSERNKGAVALHYAAQENKADVVLFLLKNGAKVNLQDCKGCTALHYAAYNGAVDAAKILLRYKACTDTKMNQGYTPLQVAQDMCAKKDKEQMESLLKNGNPKADGCVIC